MCAYNRLNETSSCHNKGLLTNLLREEGGFKGEPLQSFPDLSVNTNAAPASGFVISDWGATHDSVKDNVNAGLDME